MKKLTKNLKALIEAYGLETAMQVLDYMLTQEIETIEELNTGIEEELHEMGFNVEEVK